jgi:FecR protein
MKPLKLKTKTFFSKTFSITNKHTSLRVGGTLLLAFAAALLPSRAVAQDDRPDYNNNQDHNNGNNGDQDPPSRVARLGYMEGSVSFEPAGESEWVGAVPNRPMTTGDKLWADNNSRAELQLGSATIRLGANTGFSFLNLDDRTAQLQLTSGALNINVRRLDRDDVFEIDTPNQAFSIYQPGNYRVEASEDGTYTVVSVRQGEGESTGNGQNFTVHAGQRATFSGTDTLRADVEQIGGPDAFDNWAYSRDHRYESSRSAQYVSHDMVGYEDLDDYGDWRDNSDYGHVWFPSHVSAGWAPYREGHWDWISPWGWTWVDDSPWGYAPFHYGRWVDVDDRWGWVAGPIAVRPVYAPALVVFIGGGGGGGGFGANIGWFPLAPREVYVPSYRVSRGYVNRVNVSNTTVNNTAITNVYNTTIINNKTTNITNINYANRNARGGVTAVSQQAFTSAQPVNRAAVAVNAQQIAAAPMSARVAVAPTQQSVYGARAATANRVAAPPAAIANRQVIAKATPPPPPVAFSKQQQALAQHPGEALGRREVQNLRPANAPAAQPMVRQAPPGKPGTPNMAAANGTRPGQPANSPAPNRPGGNPPAPNPPAANPATARPNQPANQPGNQPANQPMSPATRPETPRPMNNHPENAPPQNARPENNRPESNRAQPVPPIENRPQPANPPAPVRNDRPPSAQPNRPQPPAPQPPVSQPGRPETPRPEANRPQPPAPTTPPPRSDRPPSAQPPRAETPRPEPPRAQQPRPETNRPEPPVRNERPAPPQPQPDRRQVDRPQADRPPQAERPQPERVPQAERPNNPPPPRAEAPRPNPEEQKQQQQRQQQQEEQKKRQQEERKPPGL